MYTLWMTGLCQSGKSTISKNLKHEYGHFVILDGDEIRKGLNKDLGFTRDERKENLRRVCEVAKILNKNGIRVIVSFVSPIESVRVMAKETIGNCFVVYVYNIVEICAERDKKGLYKKAFNDKNETLPGVQTVFEEPSCADCIIDNTGKIEPAMKTIRDFVDAIEYSIGHLDKLSD
jgi:adenylyl-sulfate kinase